MTRMLTGQPQPMVIKETFQPPLSTAKNADKSWRERIEELVFGWDLGRYQKYPIVSLEKDSAASAAV